MTFSEIRSLARAGVEIAIEVHSVDPSLYQIFQRFGEHERCSRGKTPGALAIGLPEYHRLPREAVEVGRLADRVSIAAKDAGLQVIRNQKQDVADAPRFRVGGVSFCSRATGGQMARQKRRQTEKNRGK